MNNEAASALSLLMEGNERFRKGSSSHYRYPPDLIREIGEGQEPVAAIITCVDGRVAPEVVFDQPLGSLFVSRVPGNVASDSAKWMLDLAVSDMRVPLVLVMGHTECLAIGQIIRGETGSGGSLRLDIGRAVHSAKMQDSDDLFREAVKQNALQTIEELKANSWAVRRAIEAGRLELVGAVYDVHTGQVEILESRGTQ